MELNNLLQNFGWAINKVLMLSEHQMLLSGKALAESMKSKKCIKSLSEVEFKVFSQFGDDGIIQWLVNNLDIPNKTFIEFGVEDYRESNTRFLMMNDNWSGFVMDGSEQNVSRIVNSEYYWKHELFSKCAFIDRTNINSLIASCSFDKDVGLLHIDLDGNDYWIWKEINVISPIVVILEYNSVFGIDRAITVPYDKAFMRTRAHYSNLYFGASLRALHTLSAEKGYSFIGCNSAGNNAFFVRNDKINDIVRTTSLEAGYVVSKFRDSRDKSGHLTYVAGGDRLNVINGMSVINTDTGKMETL
ncbi:MAG: NADH dehydrogenase [Candidatus Muproteobacteria bacterium RIFCSPHIGHO2_01_60_12]|nr:MAG: NADH dehydrogenase [Candidatus Muproteobacteria bacterium RIFCSPHIGHO2_01_60_12]